MKTAKRKKSSRKKAKVAGRKTKIMALDLLKQDHKMVLDIFKEYRKLVKDDGDDRRKMQLVQQACDALTVHAEIEEEIFYPAVRRQIDDAELMDEAEVEHDAAKDLIAQLEQMEPGDRLFDAKFLVLGEQVKHHIAEEEGKIFPKVKKAKLDLEEMGQEIAAYKRELEQDMQGPQQRDSQRQRAPMQREEYRGNQYY